MIVEKTNSLVDYKQEYVRSQIFDLQNYDLLLKGRVLFLAAAN